jgi:hypothetical protein
MELALGQLGGIAPPQIGSPIPRIRQPSARVPSASRSSSSLREPTITSTGSSRWEETCASGGDGVVIAHGQAREKRLEARLERHVVLIRV